MNTLKQFVSYLLTYRDLIGLAIQACLLFMIFALIRALAQQTRAASAQAKAAMQQVRAADLQAEQAHIHAELLRAQIRAAEQHVEKTKAREEDQVRKEIFSSRPNFRFRDADPGFKTSPVMIRNVGPGVAYRTTWRFLSPNKPELLNQVFEIGTLAIGQEIAIPWGVDKETPRLQTRLLDEYGIRVECMDGEGRLYSTVARLNGQSEFLTDSERILPEGSPVMRLENDTLERVQV
jgi:hypothetical protein